MNYFVLILVGIAGVMLGMYLAQRPSVASRGGGRQASDGSTAEPLDCIQDEQTAKKMENPTSQGYEGQRKAESKQKILAFV